MSELETGLRRLELAEFKLKKGQKIYHIREFSSVLELARRKLIAPGDPIFVPSVGRWVYASAIQELRPILQDPDHPSDDALELPLEFVEPLAEDLDGGLTVEVDADDFGIGVSAIEKQLEPLSASGRARQIVRRPAASSPGILVQPPEPSASDWSDEKPTDPGLWVVGAMASRSPEPRTPSDTPSGTATGPSRSRPRSSGEHELKPASSIRGKDSRELQSILAATAPGPGPGTPGLEPPGYGPAWDPREAPPSGSGFSRNGRGYEPAAGYGAPPSGQGPARVSSPGHGPEYEPNPGYGPGYEPYPGYGPGYEPNPYAAVDLQGQGLEQPPGAGGRRRELEPISSRAPGFNGGPALKGWVNGKGRQRTHAAGGRAEGRLGEVAAGTEAWGTTPDAGPSHRPGSGGLHSPVPFQDWVEEQSRRSGLAPPPRDLTPHVDAVVEPKAPPPKRGFNPLRLAALVTVIFGTFGAFFWYVKSTADLPFKPLDAQASTDRGPTPLPKPVIIDPAAPEPSTLADDRRLREMIRPQQSPMRTFDQAQDELFGELVNLKVSVADVKLDPVEGKRTQSIRTGRSDLAVRIKEGRYSIDEQTALVGLVAGKYAKRKPQDQNKLNLRSLVIQIEREGDEPLMRRVSGVSAADYFNRSKDVREFLLEAQAGTVIP